MNRHQRRAAKASAKKEPTGGLFTQRGTLPPETPRETHSLLAHWRQNIESSWGDDAPPMIFVGHRDDGESLAIVPTVKGRVPGSKADAINAIAQAFKDFGAVRYVFSMELDTWSWGENIDPSDDANRMTRLLAGAVGEDGIKSVGAYEIGVSSEGKRTLSNWELSAEPKGWMLDLLGRTDDKPTSVH